MKFFYPIFSISALMLAGCATGNTSGEIETYNIAANTVACTGVGEQRCLVVNGEYFYDDIEDYTHVEGRPAQICVMRSSATRPVPADASAFTYRQVACA